MPTEAAATLQIVCPHCQAANRVPNARLGESPQCGRCKQPLFDGRPVALDAAAFERHATRSDLPLVVDFWAQWCGPCHAMAPALERATRELEPRVRVAKVDTDREQALAARFAIRSIPTLVMLKGGAEVARVSGAMSAPALIDWIRSRL
jgi:thioredoxin 2